MEIRNGWDIDYLFDKINSLLEDQSGSNWLDDRIQSVSLSFNAIFGGSIDLDFSDKPRLRVEQIEQISGEYTQDQQLIIIVQDVFHLNEEPEVIDGRLSELSEVFGENITLITTGIRELQEAKNIKSTPISKTSAADWLQSQFPEISRSEALEIAEGSEGYPLVLELLVKTHNSVEEIEEDIISSDDFNGPEPVLIDFTRSFLRFLVAKTSTKSDTTAIEEGTMITEKALNKLADDKIEGTELEGLTDNTVQQLLYYSKKYQEADDVGANAFIGCLLAAYGHNKLNDGESDKYLKFIFAAISEVGIAESQVQRLYQIFINFESRVDLSSIFASTIEQNLDNLLNTVDDSSSSKETLMHAQSNIDDTFVKSIIEAYLKLSDHPRDLMRLTDDVGIVLMGNKNTISYALMWY